MPLTGLEPATRCLEGSCSVQMSYRGSMGAYYTINSRSCETQYYYSFPFLSFPFPRTTKPFTLHSFEIPLYSLAYSPVLPKHFPCTPQALSLYSKMKGSVRATQMVSTYFVEGQYRQNKHSTPTKKGSQHSNNEPHGCHVWTGRCRRHTCPLIFHTKGFNHLLMSSVKTLAERICA